MTTADWQEYEAWLDSLPGWQPERVEPEWQAVGLFDDERE